ncbi:MAG: hypothetical protein ACO1SV_09380 [Fimbriimonas sp.]
MSINKAVAGALAMGYVLVGTLIAFQAQAWKGGRVDFKTVPFLQGTLLGSAMDGNAATSEAYRPIVWIIVAVLVAAMSLAAVPSDSRRDGYGLVLAASAPLVLSALAWNRYMIFAYPPLGPILTIAIFVIATAIVVGSVIYLIRSLITLVVKHERRRFDPARTGLVATSVFLCVAALFYLDRLNIQLLFSGGS